MNTNEVYKNAIKDLMFKGIETNPRNMKVKELIPYIFYLNSDDNIITLKGFETNIDYAKEELKWYIAATPFIDFSDKIKKVWEKYSDDGKTVNSNYGVRIFNKYNGVSQWKWCIDKLYNDNDTRQAVININNINDKILETKDFPCTLSIQSFIRNNNLDWIVNMRSNDIVLGFRNDLYCFTELQKLMAKELNVNNGKYIHISNNLHIYEKHFEKARKLLESE